MNRTLWLLFCFHIVTQIVKNLPTMQETWVQALGLGRCPGTHSSILAWRIPWTEEPGMPQSMGLQRVGHDLATNTSWYFNAFFNHSEYQNF